ncbi:MAG: CinA family protein, partial [Clostridia bacterium]
YIYSCDDEELAQVVADRLMEQGLTLSSAESCTGGMFASTMTDIPGISQCFDRGLVTYSNQSKMEELGVSAGTLEKFGAVSEETALEMVEGLKRVSGSDVCISVTGIAGPGGGSEEKPVGLVYIGFSYGDKKICKKIQMRNVNRSWNRHYTLLCMLNVIYRNI